MVQADNVFLPPKVTTEVRLRIQRATGALNSDRGPQLSAPAVQFYNKYPWLRTPALDYRISHHLQALSFAMQTIILLFCSKGKTVL